MKETKIIRRNSKDKNTKQPTNKKNHKENKFKFKQKQITEKQSK